MLYDTASCIAVDDDARSLRLCDIWTSGMISRTRPDSTISTLVSLQRNLPPTTYYTSYLPPSIYAHIYADLTSYQPEQAEANKLHDLDKASSYTKSSFDKSNTFREERKDKASSNDHTRRVNDLHYSQVCYRRQIRIYCHCTVLCLKSRGIGTGNWTGWLMHNFNFTMHSTFRIRGLRGALFANVQSQVLGTNNKVQESRFRFRRLCAGIHQRGSTFFA